MTSKAYHNQDLLVCPNCLHQLTFVTTSVNCSHCDSHYPISESGILDLRLRCTKKVQVIFEIGCRHKKAEPDFGVMSANPAPEVNFNAAELPVHLSADMASHIPRAPTQGSCCLDLGRGAGDYRSTLEKAGYRWVGLDYGHPKAPMWADAHSLPFPDNTFDFVISLAVMEHIEYPAVMLREVHRVLKPGGVYLGSVTYLVPFHDAASYYNMTHQGVWSALTSAGLTTIFVYADPTYLGIRAIAYSGLFTGLKRGFAYATIEPIVWLHRMYWAYKRWKNDATYRSDWQVLLNTGAFAYKAIKPHSIHQSKVSLSSQPFDDISVIVRESGERTSDSCCALLAEVLGVTTVHRVSGRPFALTLRRALQLGNELNRPWTLCIDADVLVSSGLIAFIKETQKLPNDFFAAQALVSDKLLPVDRPAGNHLYRTEKIDLALSLIPHDKVLRPETEMIQQMSALGFGLHQSRHVVGLHDFEQSFVDIFAKAYLHGHKHRPLKEYILPIWHALVEYDDDYSVALVAWRLAEAEGGTNIPQVCRDHTTSLMIANGLCFNEKQALRPMVHSDIKRLKATMEETAPHINLLQNQLQERIDADIFPPKLSLGFNLSERYRRMRTRWQDRGIGLFSKIKWRINNCSTKG